MLISVGEDNKQGETTLSDLLANAMITNGRHGLKGGNENGLESEGSENPGNPSLFIQNLILSVSA